MHHTNVIILFRILITYLRAFIRRSVIHQNYFVVGDILQALLEVALRVEVLRFVDELVCEAKYPRAALDGVSLVVRSDMVFQLLLHVSKVVQYLLQLALFLVPFRPYAVDDESEQREESPDDRRHDPCCLKQG